MRLRLSRPRRAFWLFGIAGGFGMWASMAASQAPTPPLDLQKRLELLAQSMTLIRDRHVLKPEAASLLDGAIRGMLEKVDPDSHYFNVDELAGLRRTQTQPQATAGIGIAIRKEPGQRRGQPGGARVIAATSGGAAADFGIKTDDIITHINGNAIATLAASTIETSFLGAPGSQLQLRVQRRGSETPFEVSLTRSIVSARPSVTLLEGGIVLAAIPDISPNIEDDLRQAFAQITAAGRPIQGIILDLRNSPGGTLQSAVSLADAFLDAGTIAAEKSRRTPAPIPVAVARSGNIANGKPLAVLINGGSAMAAEIAAAALRDNKRAILVGTRSAGRTSERQLIELGKSPGQTGAVLLTTRRYSAPAGDTIDGKGLIPDIPVEQSAPDSACRDTDVQSATGVCAPRPAAADTQLLWAHVLVRDKLKDLASP